MTDIKCDTCGAVVSNFYHGSGYRCPLCIWTQLGSALEERDRLQNDLTLEKSSCRVLQAKLRTREAERARLREACKRVNAFLWGKALQGGQEMIAMLVAALYPTNSDGAVATEGADSVPPVVQGANDGRE